MARGDMFKRDFFPKKELFPQRPELFPKKDSTAATKPEKVAKVEKAKPVKAEKKAPEKAAKATRKKEVTLPKARYELWSYDEYQQGSIVASATDLQKVVDRAKSYATETNVDNALAIDDRLKSWEIFFPQIFDGDEADKTILYGGNKKNGNHQVWLIEDDKWVLKPIPSGTKLRFFLGSLSKGRAKEAWYLQNHLKKEINSLSDIALDRKTVLFIKVINQ